MLVSILPKLSVSSFMGYLKGKSSITNRLKSLNLKKSKFYIIIKNINNRSF